MSFHSMKWMAVILVAWAAGAVRAAETPTITYRPTQFIGADDRGVTLRGNFQVTAPPLRCLRVYFYLWLDTNTVLKSGDRDLRWHWNDLVCPSNGTTFEWNDCRLTIPLKDISAAENLPRGKTTKVFAACDVYDYSLKKWLGSGWDTRVALHITTDDDGKVLSVTAADRKPAPPTPPAPPGQDNDQSAAIALVKKLGGWVEVDEVAPGRPVVRVSLRGPSPDPPPGSSPRWKPEVSPVTDDTLAQLKSLTSLRDLDLARTRISHKGLKQLTAFPYLETLNLQETAVGDAGLEHIAKLPRLRKLSLGMLNGDGLSYLKDQPALETLVVGPMKDTNLGLAHLRNLRHLLSLELSRSSLYKTGLEHLGALKELESLTIRGCIAYGTGLESLRKLSRMRELTLSDLSVAKPSLTFLEGMPDLETLCLSHIAAGDFSSLSKLTHLRKLVLRAMAITDADLKPLSGLDQMEELDLGETHITDEGLKHLKGLTRLHVLDLRYDRIRDKGLEHLKGLSGLRKLNLQDTRITDGGLKHLMELSELEELHLRFEIGGGKSGPRRLNERFTREGIEELRQALPRTRID